MPSEAKVGWRPSGRTSGLPPMVTFTDLSTWVEAWPSSARQPSPVSRSMTMIAPRVPLSVM